MSFNHKTTVFTPTYNRAYILHNLYHSLQRQTCRDFEWLIVDDGSTDNTEALVTSWIAEDNDFPIRYYKQPNGGKHRAINWALDLAQGRLFFTVDSDDYLTDDALEKILRWETMLPRDNTFCGFAGNLGTSPVKTPNTPIQGDYFDGTALNRYKEIDGERAHVFYTDIHRQYKYPEFEGERFMTEAIPWNRMANDGYKLRYFNDIIWIYEYKADGLTKAGSKLFLDNPRGYGLILREKAEFLHYTKQQFLKMYYTFTCDLSSRYSSRMIAECIGAPFLLIAAINTAHKLIHLIKRTSS